ncbi:MAG: phosphatase PAP2 family protein [Gemmatimonadales bacterium]|nr:phosphatase PAP2 family protein [Gemmatimonadales bacterium]
MSEGRREGTREGGGAITEARQAWRALILTLVAFGVASLVDQWAYQNLWNPKVYDRDWGRLLRVMGFLGTWAALAAAVRLHEGGGAGGPRRAARRAWLLLGSAAVGGLVAEVLKLLIRRERPEIHAGLYGFRSFAERTWSTAGLALPSSHTLVAFGGAAMLARLYPRARWVGYTLAAGCGITRVLARAHFVSDVTLAAGLGWLVAWALTRRWPPDGAPSDEATPAGAT